jgi:hypothetical protein
MKKDHYKNGENGAQRRSTRFDVLDAHMERVAIKKRHPEYPNITPYGLYLIEKDRHRRKKRNNGE